MSLKVSSAIGISILIGFLGPFGCTSKTKEKRSPGSAGEVPERAETLTCTKAHIALGFINKEGKVVIARQFDEVGDFSEGLAWVKKGDLYGYIDRNGKYVIPPAKYSGAGHFRGGVARLIKYAPGRDNSYIFINKKGKKIYQSPGNYCGPFSEGYAVGRHRPQFGVMDTKGAWKPLKPKGVYFWSVGEVSEGLIAFTAQNDDHTFNSGYVTVEGKLAIRSPYYAHGAFSEGRAKVALEVAITPYDYGFIDTTGKLVIPGPFNHASTFSEGVAAVQAGKQGEYKWGYVDKAGKTVVPFKYEEAGDFSEGLAPVQVNRKWGFIDKTGAVVITPVYDEVGSFSEGLAMAEKNGLQGFINKSGKVVITFVYSKLGPFRNGLAAIRQKHHWGFVDGKGKFVIPPRFDGCENYSEGRAPVKIGALWGAVDRKGTLVVPTEYAKIHPYNEGRTCAELANLHLKLYHQSIRDLRIPRKRPALYKGGPMEFMEGNHFEVLDEYGKPLPALKNRITSCNPFYNGKAEITIKAGPTSDPRGKRVDITIDRSGNRIDTGKK
mgnify:CR=1 FL=1